MTPEFREFLTRAITGVGIVDGVEISHPSLSTSIYITSMYPGFTDADGRVFEYVPIAVNRSSQQNNLAQQFKFTIQDINEVVAVYCDQIPLDTEEKPRVILRSYLYRDDGVTADVQDGPYDLVAENITFTEQGCTFTATAQQTNYSGTGIIYTGTVFPTLQAYMQ